MADTPKKVIDRLNREIRQIKGRSVAGLLEAGLGIERLSNQRTPREYGNLIGSSYTRVAQDDPNAVEIGYTAEYAVWIHENTEQKLKGQPRPSGLGVYWGPAGQPKFLESAVRDREQVTVQIVAKRAQVKPGVAQ